MGSYYLMGIEFQLGMITRVLEIDCGDSCIIWMYLKLLNYTVKIGQNGKFYVMYILLQFVKMCTWCPNKHTLKTRER
jgi:hypothetical protein